VGFALMRGPPARPPVSNPGSNLALAGRSSVRRGIVLDNFKILHGLTEELPETDHAGGSHGNTRVNGHHAHAGSAVDDQAGGKVEVEFLLSGIDENVIGITRSHVLVFDLERELLLLRLRSERWDAGNIEGWQIGRHGTVELPPLPDFATVEPETYRRFSICRIADF
jgi:hypothetical protein